MTVGCVFFDCDGTLVDSEMLCTQAYIKTFARFGVHLPLKETFEKYKGVTLFEVIADIRTKYPLSAATAELEPLYRQEVARLFDISLQPIPGAAGLLKKMTVPMCVVSNGTTAKMQHSLGLTGMLHHFDDRLYSGYTISRWKPDPALMFYAAEQMAIPIENCILVDDSEAGVKAGIAAGIPVFYYCADAHNKPFDHPLVTPFQHMAALPKLWRERGWTITI